MAASPQALGGALTYNPLLTGDTNAKLYALQKQAALAQALQGEGLTPLDTNNRQIGGVGYKISPFEGLNKIAQALGGTAMQGQAAKDYSDIYNPQTTQQPGQNQGIYSDMAIRMQQGDPTAMQQYGTYMLGNPDTARAGAELIGMTMKPALAGPTAYNTKVGEAAAGNAPAGAPAYVNPGSITQNPPPSQLSPQFNAAALANIRADTGTSAPPIDNQIAANKLQAPVPPSPTPLPQGSQTTQRDASFMPSPLPGETNNQYEARLKSLTAGATSQAEAQGKNVAEAEKGKATIDSRFDNSMAILDEMKRLAPLTSGGPAAGVMDYLHSANHFGKGDETSGNNASFENLASNQLTTALAPIVQGVGGRIDIPLMRAIQEAESVKLSDSEAAKLRVVGNLQNMLAVQRQNAGNLSNELQGNPNSPQQSPITAPAAGPPIHWVIKNGQLVRQ